MEHTSAPVATLDLDDFDYALPPELIAQRPPAVRSDARLLDATGAGGAVSRSVRDLPMLLREGDLLVVNDTRVVKARLRGSKATGGAVEALLERVDADDPLLVHAHVRASKPPRPGTTIRFADAFDAEVVGRSGDDGSLFALRFPDDPYALLDRHGHVPLPPYISRGAAGDDADDERRYQTVFAARPGAVAAPTAALHFDPPLLDALAARGVERVAVTLHVGAGTFLPVRGDSIASHTMHRERYAVEDDVVDAVARTRSRGGRVVAVGTTSLRALESAARATGALRAASGETDLFIRPGYVFRVVDVLLTNFHLPRSTLLMLVSAFAGHARILSLYRRAVDERYRFFSYGDAMLLARTESP